MLHHIGLTRSRVLPAHAAHQSAGLHNVQNRKEWGSDVNRPFLTSRISLPEKGEAVEALVAFGRKGTCGAKDPLAGFHRCVHPFGSVQWCK